MLGPKKCIAASSAEPDNDLRDEGSGPSFDQGIRHDRELSRNARAALGTIAQAKALHGKLPLATMAGS